MPTIKNAIKISPLPASCSELARYCFRSPIAAADFTATIRGDKRLAFGNRHPSYPIG